MYSGVQGLREQAEERGLWYAPVLRTQWSYLVLCWSLVVYLEEPHLLL